YVCLQCLLHSRRCIGWCFFFSSRRRHTRLVSDWSSDVCSSDLAVVADNYYSATKGLQALEVKWDEGKLATLTSADILKHYAELRSEERRVGKECRSRWSTYH